MAAGQPLDTRNPKSENRSPRPETRNPKPQIRNRNPKAEAAWRQGNLRVVQCLLELGASAKLVTREGERPVDVAPAGTLRELLRVPTGYPF